METVVRLPDNQNLVAGELGMILVHRLASNVLTLHNMSFMRLPWSAHPREDSNLQLSDP